jgi:DNA polymerase
MESGFVPVLLPEDEAPSNIISCKKCELCNHKTRVIWGEGNPNANILIILDNPGSRVNKDGQEFVCGTRQTLQLAVRKVNLDIRDMYVTYILKCRPIRHYNKEEARRICVEYLTQQIAELNPKLAFCLGNTAVQWFFNNETADVKNLRGRWYNVRGLPTSATYHPLAINRRPNLFNQYLLDWETLAKQYFIQGLSLK